MQAFGWRSAAIMAGIGIFIFVVPMSLLLRHKPEEYGYLPDGEDPTLTPNTNETDPDSTKRTVSTNLSLIHI